MPLAEELEVAAAAARWRDVDRLLSSLDMDGLTDAKAWYRKGGRTRTRRVLAKTWAGSSPEELDAAACLDLLAATLAPTPQQAAAWCGWSLWSGWNSGRPTATVVQAFARNGRDWCADFVEAASAVIVPKANPAAARRISNYVKPLLVAYGLPVPAGPAFVQGWASEFSAILGQARWAPTVVQRNPAAPFLLVHRDSVVGSGPAAMVVTDTCRIDTLSLLELWRTEPGLPDVFAAVLAAPGLAGQLASATAGWEVGPAVAALVQEGLLDRDRLIADSLSALTRQDTPATQRVVAQVLSAVELTARDTPGQLALLQGLLATSQGSVTAVLLPAALDLVQSPDDMSELATTIMGRKEKRQQSDLVRALTARDADDRFGTASVRAGLESATQASDTGLAERAQRALAKALATSGSGSIPLSSPPVGPAPELWASLPAVGWPEAFVRVPPEAAELRTFLALTATSHSALDDARFLDGLLRFAAQDPAAARHWVEDEVATAERVPSSAYVTAIDWASGGLTWAGHDETIRLYARVLAEPPATYDPETWSISVQPATTSFAHLHAQECLLRAGRTGQLLSTPTWGNGVLAFDDLVHRLRHHAAGGYGPLDLFQALLRLEPVSPERVGELDGVSVPLGRPPYRPGSSIGRWAARAGGLRTGRASADGAEIVRAWVRSGGADYPSAVLHGSDHHLPAAKLPVEEGAFAVVPKPLLTGVPVRPDRPSFWWNRRPAGTAGVLPLWPDHLAALLRQDILRQSKDPARWLPVLAHLGGECGDGALDVVARVLAYPDEDSRLLAVEAVTALAAQGRFDPERFAATCLRLLEIKALPLARTASALEQVVLAGAMAQVWPAVLALAERGCSAKPRPAGLLEILSLVRRFGAAAPDPQVPQSVRDLAARPGSSKAQVEARAICTGLSVAGQGSS